MTPREPPSEDLWIFGYGSLVWRPDFSFAERRNGFILDHERRFWQGSTDHRGSPGRPGRVVTLVPRRGARCWGTAYRLLPAGAEEVLARLDYRERGGFDRKQVDVHIRSDRGISLRVRAELYLAAPSNPNYLGSASLDAIAEQVRAARGPSGSNLDYVLELAEALRAMGAEDDHVFALEALLRTGKG